MALNDVFQITHDMTYLGKNSINVYHALRTSSVEKANDISDAFQESVLPDLRALQSEKVFNNELRIFNLGDSADFGTSTLSSAPGLRAGTHSPTFIASTIRFPSLDREVRAGFKRFVGMLESDYTDGVLLAAPIALLVSIGDAILGDWIDSVDAHKICDFIVVKRVCDETDPATGKCLKYRLPELDGELVFYEPLTGVVPTEITSQVSRKK